MRCPYCGANSFRASYCTSCGRDIPPLRDQVANNQQGQPLRPVQPTQGYPPAQQQPSYQSQQQRPGGPPQGRPGTAPGMQPQTSRVQSPPPPQQPAPHVRQVAPIAPPPPPAPDPPAPFPPRTLAHLQALEVGALLSTVIDTIISNRRRKIVRIEYPRCVGWQQAATLFKVLNEQQDERYETIIIQGYQPQSPHEYSFTQGQLSYDRNVQLGNQVMNRYVVETGNGFESDSVRIVLSE
jgi:hypothetical protein